jgi:hypothetical protein
VDIDLGVELTELEKLEVTRVDAVGRPANGFPVLMMKGITAPPEEPAAKADAGDGDGDDEKCKTCGGKGTVMDGNRDCPDCDGPAEKSALDIAVKAVTGGTIDQAPDISVGHQIMGLLAQAIQQEAQEIAVRRGGRRRAADRRDGDDRQVAGARAGTRPGGRRHGAHAVGRQGRA